MGNRILTDKQLAMLEFIRQFRADHGRSPTWMEIGNHFGFKNYCQHITRTVKPMVEKKYLKKVGKEYIPCDKWFPDPLTNGRRKKSKAGSAGG